MNKVITIKDNKVVPDVNVLGISELKVLYDKFEEPDRSLLFQYLYHLYDPESPYANLHQDEREERVKKDFKGNYKPNHDEHILKAKKKLEDLFFDPIMELLEGMRMNIREISLALKTTKVTTGKDGNLTQFTSFHKTARDLAKNYDATVQDFKVRVAKNRGNSKEAIDEGDDY